MLPAAHRITDAASFREATRRGRRAVGSSMVVHLVTRPASRGGSSDPDVAPARVGFVVSKAVGNSVVRNRVQRRLRHLARARWRALPAGSILVVRALPVASASSSASLGRDFDACLSKVGVGSSVESS